MSLRKGDKVKWASNGRLKHGIVQAVVPAKDNPRLHLRKDLSLRQIKFSGSNANYTRYIVAVPRGGQSELADYYCPKPGALEVDSDEESVMT
ncbi:hypothetical protein [Paenibacillus senegalimassiliensis]|uniref:hypothetical protein n=1 Tax=Paenibacillus senegalimassiliensis TaxID=1737426 RepID=UPI00073E46C7|nr:hypothetical protein [Paenibacillus senegalimassiliensis]